MQEKQKKWILRIALYLIGIMVLALGITLNTKTNLAYRPSSPCRTPWHRSSAMKQEPPFSWRI